MAEPWFFVSYWQHPSDQAAVARFFDRLSLEVAYEAQQDVDPQAPVGILDKEDIVLGELWNPRLARRLGESRVLVGLASPGMFRSRFCAYEWALFEHRCARYAEDVGQDDPPPLILAVPWSFDPVGPEWPPEVNDRQQVTFAAADLAGAPPFPTVSSRAADLFAKLCTVQTGLRYLFSPEQQHADFVALCEWVCKYLAVRIVRAARADRLPVLPHPPAFGDLEPKKWTLRSQVAIERGPTSVWTCVAAPSRADAPHDAPAPVAARYRENPQKWLPFHPADSTGAGAMVRDTCDELGQRMGFVRYALGPLQEKRATSCTALVMLRDPSWRRDPDPLAALDGDHRLLVLTLDPDGPGTDTCCRTPPEVRARVGAHVSRLLGASATGANVALAAPAGSPAVLPQLGTRLAMPTVDVALLMRAVDRPLVPNLPPPPQVSI